MTNVVHLKRPTVFRNKDRGYDWKECQEFDYVGVWRQVEIQQKNRISDYLEMYVSAVTLAEGIVVASLIKNDKESVDTLMKYFNEAIYTGKEFILADISKKCRGYLAVIEGTPAWIAPGYLL